MKFMKNNFAKEFKKNANYNPNYQEIENKTELKKAKFRFPRWAKITSAVAACLLIIVSVPAALIFDINIDRDAKKPYKENFQRGYIDVGYEETFRALNEVTYPEFDPYYNFDELDEEYVNGVNTFAYEAFNYTLNNSTSNFVFSPFSLYSNVDMLSTMSEDSSIQRFYNEVLHASNSLRRNNFRRAYSNNYRYKERFFSVQSYNFGIFNNTLDVRQNYAKEVEREYFQLYQMDYSSESDKNKLINLINNAMVDSSSYINQDDLDFYKNDIMILSILNFQSKWKDVFYLVEGTSPFYTSDGRSVSAQYMNHTIFKNKAYKYDKYYSFYDSYYAGLYEVQYLYPINSNDNILDLVKGVNFLIEDPNNEVIPEYLDLTIPKFKTVSEFDFKSFLVEQGLSFLDEFNSEAYSKAINFNQEYDSIKINNVIQKNSIEFREEGTKGLSVTISAGAASPAPIEGIKVKFDQPFIYVIRDSTGLPIYIGVVNDPTIQ